MRIRWNRHLDGSSSRQEEEPKTQDSDEKKRSSSSSPAIFRIFRRKKNRKRLEDGNKVNDNTDGTVPHLFSEADEDDCASVSSVATSASQPVSEVRQRDRSSSLFSSFRLSLPGSKRKKRRIAPIPSETLTNNPENDPQMERYSTPDLRNPSEKLDMANDVQESLSTSSPSVRHLKQVSGDHLGRNIEPSEKSKSLSFNSVSSNSKLSKSVSFSNYDDNLSDFSHSTRDKNSPRAVKSSAMDEEDCGALESEFAFCMSGDLRKNHESKLTSFDNSSAPAANVSDLHKHFDDETIDTGVMTKTEVIPSSSPDVVEDSCLSDINTILNDIASEIRNYKPPKDDHEINVNYSLQCDRNALPENCVPMNYEIAYNNGTSTDSVHLEEKSKNSMQVVLETEPDVQYADIGPITSPTLKWNTLFEVCDNNNLTLVPYDGSSSIESYKISNELKSNENVLNPPVIESISSEKPLTNLNPISNETNKPEIEDMNYKKSNCSRTDFKNSHEGSEKGEGLLNKSPAIENTTHVICHMRVYENETVSDGLNGANARSKLTESENQKKEISCEFLTLSNVPHKTDFAGIQNKEHRCRDVNNVLPCVTAKFNSASNFKNSIFQPVDDPNLNDTLVTSMESKIEGDQEVPNNEFQLLKPLGKNNLSDSFPSQSDRDVPEFELSLLEFEEMCNKYTCKNHEFSACSPLPVIPHFSDPPKRKSVLDTSYSFMYPYFNENCDFKLSSKATSGRISPVLPAHIGFIKEDMDQSSNFNLSDTCQRIADRCFLPLPPKQWINYEKSIENKYNSNVCADRVQCTVVRGKNLCQEPCPEALPTIVMLDDSDLEGIDTPDVSSTPRTVVNKSGRDNTADVASEKLKLHNIERKDMVSNVSITLSTLNSALEYPCISESSSKSSAYLQSQITDPFCAQRTVSDRVYRDVTKKLESLGSGDYLSGHNFCDMRNINLCGVISDVPCNLLQSGSGLIEISNPYQEDVCIIPRETFVNHAVFESDRNANTISELKCPTPADNNISQVDGQTGCKTVEVKENSFNPETTEESSSNEISLNINKLCTENETLEVLNGDSCSKQNGLSYTEQKNLINKNKTSMIPCLKKKHFDTELKRTDAKSKTKNSLTGFYKSESTVPVKIIKSRRVFSSHSKDPSEEYSFSKQKASSVKYNGVDSSDKYKTKSEISKLKENTESKSNLESMEIKSFNDSGVHAEQDRKANNFYSTCEWKVPDYSSSVKRLDREIKPNSMDLDGNIDLTNDNVATSENTKINLSSSVVTKDGSNFCPSPEVSLNEIGNLDYVTRSDRSYSICSVPESDHKNYDSVEEFNSNFSMYDHKTGDGILSENYTNGCIYSKFEDYETSSRRSSITGVSLIKRSFTSSKESLNSQMTNSSRSNKGKSRIPRKQPGTRGAQPSSKGPVRPPMWLSKAELTQEIQRLGTLCEARTKELNRLKMETKHVSSGFDAFAALFKYMVEDLNGLSVPTLTEDLEKTLKQLELTKQDLAFYEREVEEMKSHHCQELNDLSNKLFEVYHSEVAELNAKHQEEINHLKNEHQKQIEHLTSDFEASSDEVKAHHEKMMANLEQEIINQREELQLFQEREIKDLEEKHAESTKMLQEHIEQLQKKCAELKQHSMSMEDAMKKDTDSKLQWVTSVKLDLEKEVESLKTVLEMKNKELHTLRVQNLEMEKQLEELPLAREKIKMLHARAEDLEALMLEKTKIERKLSTENQQIRDTYEKESKVNRRLSMENEELQWRLRQAENSLISGSFSEVPEFPEEMENPATSPVKSPGPHLMSRSVFFTFVDKGESSPHSPRSQYKKITPNFSANYRSSPVKASKSPPVPSPRRGKSHSDPPQPIIMTSTPRINAKQPLNKSKGTQKRQRSGSDSSKPVSDHTEVIFSSVTESMASSVSSDSSVFEHKERLLEEHKEHIIQSLEILREQRSSESADENTVVGKKWNSDEIKVTGELSHLENEDMSRSAEFADPKTYYHMTFPVLKESGITDCDTEDGKNLSSGSSPMKEVISNTMHSMSENDINHAVEIEAHTVQIMSESSHEASITLIADKKQNGCSELLNKRNSCSTPDTTKNVQKEDCSLVENRWRTI